ncbi:MAG: hypothetical protein EBT68_07505 [Verrucomicrobia bacterium]|nr:hypothetical protein [Verrucomicrobiota bacterium]
MKHPYDGKNEGLTPSEMHCKKIAWMVENSPEWDTENVDVEQYLEQLPDYPTDEQVEGYNHLTVALKPVVKKEEPVS